MDFCVLFTLTFCETQLRPSEVTVQTQVPFGSFTLGVPVHRIKPLVLVRPGYWWWLCRCWEKIVILEFNFQEIGKKKKDYLKGNYNKKHKFLVSWAKVALFYENVKAFSNIQASVSTWVYSDVDLAWSIFRWSFPAGKAQTGKPQEKLLTQHCKCNPAEWSVTYELRRAENALAFLFVLHFPPKKLSFCLFFNV